MRKAALFTGLVLAGVTVGCSTPNTVPESTASAPTTTASAVAPTSATAPPDPQPAADGQCPYLTSDFIADANGEKVTKVQVSADKPHPACFFYSYGNTRQITVQVYVGDVSAANGLVDRVAPVNTSDKADLTGGWAGGSLSSTTGAIYAVSKAGNAIVVTTDQKQTIKAKQVAKQAIATLGL